MLESTKRKGGEPDMFEQIEEKKWAAQKLRQMWQGNLVLMAATIFMIVMLVIMLMTAAADPFTMYVGGGLGFTLFLTLLSTVAMIVGEIIYLVGLYGLRNIQPEYRTAFQCWLVSFVLNLISSLAGEGSLIASILDLATTVLNLVVLWLVLQATNRLMEEISRDDVIQWGRTVWILNLISTVCAVVVALIPIEVATGAALALTISLAALAVSVVADFWYLGYLGRAATALTEDMW